MNTLLMLPQCFLVFQVQPLPKGDHILNFSDAEELLDDRQLLEPANELVKREMMINDKKQKKEIKLLEQELPKWQVLVESVTGKVLYHPNYQLIHVTRNCDSVLIYSGNPHFACIIHIIHCSSY